MKIVRYGKSRGIPRHEMPQIESRYIPEFLDFLIMNKIRNHKEKVRVKDLLPTQKSYNAEKVESMLKQDYDVLTKPVIVSSDHFILDGHHRYSALLLCNPDAKIEAYRVHANIDKLLEMAHNFPRTFYKGLKESISFSKFIRK